ncbi:MAG: hypothetical protein ABL914_10695 [Novosphingobium sp.]|uniref:hypothetical protein n=1 Tax=Novosphingobium sp. TaxID=1874826 RepID=UPI0032BEB90A
MSELIFLVAFFGAPLLILWLFFARLRMIRNHRWHDLGRDEETMPDVHPYEEAERTEDGLTFGRAMNFDPTLSAVSKRAEAMPDIDKTLLGRR